MANLNDLIGSPATINDEFVNFLIFSQILYNFQIHYLLQAPMMIVGQGGKRSIQEKNKGDKERRQREHSKIEMKTEGRFLEPAKYFIKMVDFLESTNCFTKKG